MRKRLSKLIIIFTAAVLSVGVFIGDKYKDKGSIEANTAAPTEEQSLVYNLGMDSFIYDPALGNTVGASTVVNQVFEGLMRLNDDNSPEFAAAESVDFDIANPVRYVFHIRKDASWADGQPLKAQDYEYAWKRILDPKTTSPYAYLLYSLKNGNAYNVKMATEEQIGVKAKDNYTLEVTLENPMPYFLQLCTLPALMPIRKDIIENQPDLWASKPETYIGNGPFKMISYTSSKEMQFARNENYWNKSKVKLENMKFVMMTNQSLALSALVSKEIDCIDLIPGKETSENINEESIISQPLAAEYFISLNNSRPPLDNLKVRKALSFAIDRQIIIDKVWQGALRPATGFIPFGISDNSYNTQFRIIGGDIISAKGDVEKAKQLFTEAGYPEGKGFPEIEYIYNKDETHKKIAQLVQEMWKTNLNIEVKLYEAEWEELIEERKTGNYFIARDGWVGDYTHPMTMLAIFTEKNSNNHARYSSKIFDNLLLEASKEKDPYKSMEILHNAEKKLIGEDMAVIPIAFYESKMACQLYIKGVRKTPTGITYFDRAYVEGKETK